jgi:hypothetical protein
MQQLQFRLEESKEEGAVQIAPVQEPAAIPLSAKSNTSPVLDGRSPKWGTKNTVAVSLAGMGVALGAAGLAVYLNNNVAYGEWQGDEEALSAVPVSERTSNQVATLDHEKQRIQTNDRIAVALASGAGVMLGLGTFLWFSGGKRKGETSSVTVAAGVAATPYGLQLSGGF